MQQLLESVAALGPVDRETARLYGARWSELADHVTAALSARSDIDKLIGHNPIELMHDNHRNHARLMASVFEHSAYGMLARVALWAYRVYTGRGFSACYFPVAFQAWQHAVRAIIPNADCSGILRAYDWLTDQHEHALALSRDACNQVSYELDPAHNRMRQEFVDELLAGDHQQCLRLAFEAVARLDDLEWFYLQIVQPAMYTVGSLWEASAITVADEHIASAIVGRVMAQLYSAWAGKVPRTRGSAVVSAAPNELHEVGARMVADLLEVDGWRVTYLGANTPERDLIALLKRVKPDLLALSIVMPYHIEVVAKLVTGVRADAALDHMRVLLGGQVLASHPELSRVVKTDGWAPDAKSGVALAAQWWGDPRE